MWLTISDIVTFAILAIIEAMIARAFFVTESEVLAHIKVKYPEYHTDLMHPLPLLSVSGRSRLMLRVLRDAYSLPRDSYLEPRYKRMRGLEGAGLFLAAAWAVSFVFFSVLSKLPG